MTIPDLLPLNSTRWGELAHSFGSASNVPDLIRALGRGEPGAAADAAWETLWSEVHHQGDTNDACYAAVPHVIRIALEAGRHCSWMFFGWPASIEVRRIRANGPRISADLQAAYDWAMGAIPEAIRMQAVYPWDHVFAQASAAALVASRGQALLGDALLELGHSVTNDFFRWQFGEEA